MSSHHFVKEGQEPALFVVDPIADDHLLSILEWSPMIIVAGEAMSKVASWGIRVDAIVLSDGTHNASVVHDMMKYVGPADLISSLNGPVDAVLSYLRSKNQYALQVLLQTPEKSLSLWEQAGDFQVTLIGSRQKWSRIQDGHFGKWIPAGTSLQVIGNDLTLNRTPFDGEQIVVEASGIVELASPGTFWVGEEHS